MQVSRTITSQQNTSFTYLTFSVDTLMDEFKNLDMEYFEFHYRIESLLIRHFRFFGPSRIQWMDQKQRSFSRAFLKKEVCG